MKVHIYIGLISLLSCCHSTSASWRDSLQCLTCRLTLPFVRAIVRLTGSGAIIKHYAYPVCSWLGEVDEVCQGYIDGWMEPVTFILRYSQLDSKRICGLYLPSCRSEEDLYELTHVVNISNGGMGFPQDLPYPTPDTNSTFHVLQIADFHLDINYTVGASNQCDRPLCCHKENGWAADYPHRAKNWGDYLCDTPPSLMSLFFEKWKRLNQTDLAYVIWSGDTAPHDSWRTSREDVIRVIRSITTATKYCFPRKLVVPVIGNHDSAPINFFPPWDYQKKIDWPYGILADIWADWLPKSAVNTFRNGGFYEYDQIAGLKILVINTNIAYIRNPWVAFTAKTDTYNQLSWLQERLLKARQNGERCHIVGHISPADRHILPSWSYAYHQIISIFRDVVTAQFFSHTHFREIQLFHDENQEPFSVAYMAPSITPWKNLDPGFNIYRLSPADEPRPFEVVDIEIYNFDLERSNSVNDRLWSEFTTTSSYFGLTDLSPKTWKIQVQNWLLGSNFDFEYYQRYRTGRSVFAYYPDCDGICRFETICSIVTTDGRDLHPCIGLISPLINTPFQPA